MMPKIRRKLDGKLDGKRSFIYKGRPKIRKIRKINRILPNSSKLFLSKMAFGIDKDITNNFPNSLNSRGLFINAPSNSRPNFRLIFGKRFREIFDIFDIFEKAQISKISQGAW